MRPLRIKIILIIGLSLLSTLGFNWQRQIKVLAEENIVCLVKDATNDSIIYAASQDSVYKTDNKGKSWNKIFSKEGINKIYFDSLNEFVYILTDGGLYRGRGDANTWDVVFKGSSDLESNCICLAISHEAIFLGTKEGLFISNDQARNWHKLSEQFSDSVISALATDPRNDNFVYVASDRGVFITQDNGRTWKRVYIVYSSEVPEEDYADYNGEVSDKVVSIYDLVVYNKEPYKVYTATKNGVFFSEDKGNTWQEVTNVGLRYSSVRSMKISDDGRDLFLATDKGIFMFKGNTWQNLTGNIGFNDFYDMVLDDANATMLAAGRGGVYGVNISQGLSDVNMPIDAEQDLNIDDLFKDEPSIAEVQKAAIKYADVDMAKIKNWRRQSRLKALFPRVDVGYDKNIWGSSSGPITVGPRGWNMDFSWDIADLIWNSDETSIDSRSRLTVQLRQDILDEVTRLYYERRRLKSELVLFPPKDKAEKLQRNLQIEEVTANLDGLTNGYFSKATHTK